MRFLLQLKVKSKLKHATLFFKQTLCTPQNGNSNVIQLENTQ